MPRRHADDQPADPAFAHRRQFCRDELDMPVRHERAARVQLAESARRKAREVVAQQRRTVAARRVPADDRRRRGQRGGSEVAAAAASAASAAIWRRKRATNWSTTSRSGAVNLAGSGAAAPAFCSTSFIMSNSILVARKSALADLLTICVTIASRLVILRRLPSIVT